jgi:predicted ATPase
MYGASTSPCETTDFLYPMLADVYYSVIEQNEYGKPIKTWVFDKTITCNAQPITKRTQEEISPAVFLQSEGKLLARCRSDIRTSSKNANNSITNILITNVRFPGDQLVYRETAGPRSGRGTIFEIATLEPFVGGLQTIEYYFMMWRRSENQTVDDK